MSHCSLVHIPIAAMPPLERTPENKVVFRVSLDVVNGSIQLQMRQEGCKEQDFIAIEEDSEVVIELHGKQLFFSREFDAITTKGDFSSYYGGLAYDEYDSERDRYRRVSFVARANPRGKRGTRHPFNLNIDLYQPDSEPEWVPISIDPDIKNPPPWPLRSRTDG